MSTIGPTVTTHLESSPPTISVEVNGKSSTANLPNGGDSGTEIWEKIDLDNPSSDFSIGDILLIKLNKYVTTTISPSSWTSAISDPFAVYQQAEICVIVPIAQNSTVVQIPITTSSTPAYIRINTLGKKPTVDEMNNLKSSNFLHFTSYIFNGTGLKEVEADRDISYVNELYRIKTSV